MKRDILIMDCSRKEELLTEKEESFKHKRKAGSTEGVSVLPAFLLFRMDLISSVSFPIGILIEASFL